MSHWNFRIVVDDCNYDHDTKTITMKPTDEQSAAVIEVFYSGKRVVGWQSEPRANTVVFYDYLFGKEDGIFSNFDPLTRRIKKHIVINGKDCFDEKKFPAFEEKEKDLIADCTTSLERQMQALARPVLYTSKLFKTIRRRQIRREKKNTKIS